MASSSSPSSAKKSQSPKVKRKGKKKEKEDEAKKKAAEEEEEKNEAEFQKVLLEIRVNELETLNLGLKRKCDYLESQNDVYKTQLQETRQEKEELVGYLERSCKEEKQLVKDLEEKLVTAQYKLKCDTKSYQQKLSEKESEFDKMKYNFETQVSNLEIQMTALDEFQAQKDELNRKFSQLQNAFEEERKSHEKKYEDMENEMINYREKIKSDAVETLLEIAKDVQKAGKLCLTGAIKAAIVANVKLRQELETVSSDNLELRDRLQVLSVNHQKTRSVLAESEKLKSIEKRKSEQFKHIVQVLVDKQCDMDDRIKNIRRTEKGLADLQKLHALCKSDREIENMMYDKTLELVKKDKEIHEAFQTEKHLKTQLRKREEMMVKMAITAKELTEARNNEEYEYLCQRFKTMIVRLHVAASEFQNVAPELKSRLIVSAPSVLPYLTFQ